MYWLYCSNYDDSEDTPETEEDRIRAQIVSLSLHYLLSIMEIMKEDRTINDLKENHEPGDYNIPYNNASYSFSYFLIFLYEQNLYYTDTM